MTTPTATTIEALHTLPVTRIATLRLTEGEPDATHTEWNLGPITAIARHPRAPDPDLYEIWPSGLHTIIRVPHGTPVHYTLTPDPHPTPIPAPAQPVHHQTDPGTRPTPPTGAPRPAPPWLTHPPAAEPHYPPPTGQPL
ncbi:hypothetical protein [Streptomyces sp. NPDC059991]|uniref:hypothetical protein n=1 Tax=unclassified Streptomyces TaxID=2593676 RepID=UPI0036CC304D